MIQIQKVKINKLAQGQVTKPWGEVTETKIKVDAYGDKALATTSGGAKFYKEGQVVYIVVTENGDFINFVPFSAKHAAEILFEMQSGAGAPSATAPSEAVQSGSQEEFDDF